MRHIALMLLLVAGGGRLQAQDTTYAPSRALVDGKQIVAVYFGGSWCSPCRRPEMKSAIRRMKPLVAAQAKAQGASFSAMVVVFDSTLKSGLDFIEPLGAFDEYSIGPDFVSLPAQYYMWGVLPPEPAVPQVLVFERTVHAQPPKPVTFGALHVLKRIGGDSIPVWVRDGAKID